MKCSVQKCSVQSPTTHLHAIINLCLGGHKYIFFITPNTALSHISSAHVWTRTLKKKRNQEVDSGNGNHRREPFGSSFHWAVQWPQRTARRSAQERRYERERGEISSRAEAREEVSDHSKKLLIFCKSFDVSLSLLLLYSVWHGITCHNINKPVG